MKSVLLLGGPAAGRQVDVHGTMQTVCHVLGPEKVLTYHVVPMCSHGEVRWFGVLGGADPLALLIAGYGGDSEDLSQDTARIEYIGANWFYPTNGGVSYSFKEDTAHGETGCTLRQAIDWDRLP